MLSDASKEDDVLSMLQSLALPGVDYTVELALDYPTQQLAVDLFAGTTEELTTSIQRVRAELKVRLGIDAPTASELDRDILLHQSA